MAVYKLLDDDFDNDDYLLLAIHCAIDDYRLAYLLNQYLYINLKPYVGVETGEAAIKTLNLCYEHISKAIS